MKSIRIKIDSQGIGTITLNRPQTHNAFDDVLLAELHKAISDFKADSRVVVVVLEANGKSFSAGADLNWMQRIADYSEDENYQDALAMADFFHDLATFPKPTIAVVQGAALGGGMGLVACCDIVIAGESALFGLTEVKIGLIPAVISPYLSRALGDRNWQRYALTGERFGVDEALRLGLVHDVAAPGDLSTTVKALCTSLLANSPAAMAAVKSKLSNYREMNLKSQMMYTARSIAEIRVSPEGREGIAAFLEKRKPQWRG